MYSACFMLEHRVGSRLAEWGGLVFLGGGSLKPAEAVFRSAMGCLQSLLLTCRPKRGMRPQKMAQLGTSLRCQCECMGLMLPPHEKARGHGFNPRMPTMGNAETRGYLEFTSQSKQTTS